MHISDNKHEFNVRRVEELSKELNEYEEKLKTANGFFNKLKIRKAIKKIEKQLKDHNDEIFLYEQTKTE